MQADSYSETWLVLMTDQVTCRSHLLMEEKLSVHRPEGRIVEEPSEQEEAAGVV